MTKWRHLLFHINLHTFQLTVHSPQTLIHCTFYSYYCWTLWFCIRFYEEDWKANESLAYDSSSPLQVAAMMKVVPVKIRHSNIIMKTQPAKKTLSTKLNKVAAGTEYSPWNGYQLTPVQVWPIESNLLIIANIRYHVRCLYYYKYWLYHWVKLLYFVKYCANWLIIHLGPAHWGKEKRKMFIHWRSSHNNIWWIVNIYLISLTSNNIITN